MKTIEILGEKAEYYLSHVCRTIDKSQLYLPAPDTVDKVWIESDRNIRTLGSLLYLCGYCLSVNYLCCHFTAPRFRQMFL